ncbi:MAG TPA: hypothetical protein VN848_10270 [Gemmatimonadales bacterium]|nr:hypothetical protein [Gemmatimonadales bacterium]
MSTGAFLVLLVSFTGAVVVSIWTIAMAVTYAKRVSAKTALPDSRTREGLKDLDARLATLEQRVGRMEEVEERLDFVERTLGRLGEGKRLNAPGPKRPD